MKIKHNKKRNTAFVYEALIKEATLSIIKGDPARRQKVVDVIKEHFGARSILRRDLECYRALYENQNLTKEDSAKILREAKLQKRLVDPQSLFAAQTAMIHDVNKEVDSAVFNNFVPNYKTLATIDQIFSIKTDPKTVIMLENEIIDNMTNTLSENESDAPVDKLLLNTFVDKFNQKYADSLRVEQQQLLSAYISSFVDNSLSLKMYLNDEIARLKEELVRAPSTEHYEGDEEMVKKTQQVVEKLEKFASEPVSEALLLTVLRAQELVGEINSDGVDG